MVRRSRQPRESDGSPKVTAEPHRFLRLATLAPITTLALVTSAAATVWVIAVVVPAWNTRHTVLEGVEHAPSEVPRRPALARRVTFVVVDGLSFDLASELDELAAIRSESAFRELVAHYPTYTGPNITAMMTGLAPRESGIRLNGDEMGARGIDSVARSAWDAGIFVRIRSRTYDPYDFLTRPPKQADVARGRLRVPFDWALDHVRPPPTVPDGHASLLELLYVGDVDDAGHRHGSADPRYREAAKRAARFVESARAELDPERDVLFVASDHAHREAGGHGGAEPPVHRAFFAAWGRGVREGVVLDPRPMNDVASTITAVLGSRTPSSNLGAPMIDLFDLDEEASAAVLAEPFDQAAKLGCRVRATDGCSEVESARAALEQGHGAQEATALLSRMAREREDAARAEDEAQAAKGAAGGVAIGALLVALGQVRGFARPSVRSGYLAPLVLAAAFTMSLAVLGYRPSLSTMKAMDEFLVDATKAALVASVLTTLVGRRLAWGAREALFLVVSTFACLLPLWAMVGARPQALGPPVASALVFMLSPVVPAAGLTAIAVAMFRRPPAHRPHAPAIGRRV